MSNTIIIDVKSLANMFPRASAEVVAEVASVAVDQQDAVERLLELYSSCDYESPTMARALAPAKRVDVIVEARAPVLQHEKPPPALSPLVPGAFSPTVEAVAERVALLVDHAPSLALADRFGLCIEPVALEDMGRARQSLYGPCVSDLTLVVRDRMLPLIRAPNFADLTFDVTMDSFVCPVGNERSDGNGSATASVTLREYLTNVDRYLPGTCSFGSLVAAPRDSHVLTSMQACLLPVVAAEATAFQLALYHHGGGGGDSAVLCLVIAESGTSAFLVRGNAGDHGQALLFNSGGRMAPFVAKRLSDDRVARGVANNGAPMTEAEKQANVLFVVQVPLVRKAVPMFRAPPPQYFNGYAPVQAPAAAGAMAFRAASCEASFDGAAERQRRDDVEDAIVSVGERGAAMPSLADASRSFVRDARFPVRVTLQYYKATTSGHVDETTMEAIARQLRESPVRVAAAFTGSLVLNAHSNRPTETGSARPCVPPWWDTWWSTNGFQYAQFVSKEAAESLLFSTDRFAQMGMSQADVPVRETLALAVPSYPQPQPFPHPHPIPRPGFPVHPLPGPGGPGCGGDIGIARPM